MWKTDDVEWGKNSWGFPRERSEYEEIPSRMGLQGAANVSNFMKFIQIFDEILHFFLFTHWNPQKPPPHMQTKKSRQIKRRN